MSSAQPTKPKPKQFSREDIFDLIYAIEERPGIWQKPASYRTRRLLLNEIATKLKCTTADIQSQWNILRTAYHKERLRITTAKKKIGVECRSNWEFYNSLQFLYKFSNNIAENLQDMERDSDDDDTEEEKTEQGNSPQKDKKNIKLTPIIEVTDNNSQQLMELPNSKNNNFAQKASKFLNPKIRKLILLTKTVNGLSLPEDSFLNSRRAIMDNTEEHLNKIYKNSNKIFGDFVSQEMQDLDDEAQLKAKIEIQEILQKYGKAATIQEITEIGDSDRNKIASHQINIDDKKNDGFHVRDGKIILTGCCNKIVEEDMSTKSNDSNDEKAIISGSGLNHINVKSERAKGVKKSGADRHKLLENNKKINEKYKKINECIKKLNESAGDKPIFKPLACEKKPNDSSPHNKTIRVLPKENKDIPAAPKISATSFFSILS